MIDNSKEGLLEYLQKGETMSTDLPKKENAMNQIDIIGQKPDSADESEDVETVIQVPDSEEAPNVRRKCYVPRFGVVHPRQCFRQPNS